VLAAPSFSSFSSSVESAAPAESAPRTDGLFSALVGDPNVLYSDLIQYPHKYGEEASALIQALSSGQRKLQDLNPAEQQVLDRAVIDFSGSNRLPPAPPPPPTPAPKREPKEREIEYHEPVKSPFGGKPDPYWWT
jgi:hypothetical protein